MLEPTDFNFLKGMEYEAKCLEEQLSCPDHWAKPFYSDGHTFRPGVRRVFLGLNPGGDRFSRELYVEYGCEEKIWSGNEPYYNSYLDERWTKYNENPAPKGKAPLQVSVQRVFKAMYGADWKSTLRSTPCFNMIPISSEGANDPRLKMIWNKGVDWGIRLIEYLKPEFIILYGNGDKKSPWSVLESEFGLLDYREAEVLPKLNYSIKDATLATDPLDGVYVLGLPHLSRVNRAKKGVSKNLEILCTEICELTDSGLFV